VIYLPQDRIQYIEVVVLIKFLDLWKERTKGLRVYSLGHITIDWMDMK
jgi:hypothetical protein